MNALIKSEYDKLSPFQKAKFNELVGWQAATQKGMAMQLDQGAYFKILDWVKKLTNTEPPIEPKAEE